MISVLGLLRGTPRGFTAGFLTVPKSQVSFDGPELITGEKLMQ
jgi:hypothetical protein